MSFAAADSGSRKTQTIAGHLDPGAADFVYLPVQVSAGVNRISVFYAYSCFISAAEATPGYLPGPATTS